MLGHERGRGDQIQSHLIKSGSIGLLGISVIRLPEYNCSLSRDCTAILLDEIAYLSQEFHRIVKFGTDSCPRIKFLSYLMVFSVFTSTLVVADWSVSLASLRHVQSRGGYGAR